MTNKNIVFNPFLDFDYVSDSILWDDIFQKPFPVDLRNLKEGYVELTEYFEVENCFIDSGRGYKIPRKALNPTNNFFDTSRDKRIRAFRCMSNFLNRFNRPFRDCVLYVPNHPDIKPDKKFTPINFYSKTPMLPMLNDQGDMLRVVLLPQIFNEISWYCFKERRYEGRNHYLDFSFECFGGFLLQY